MHRAFALLLVFASLLVSGCGRGGNTTQVPPPVASDSTDLANLVIAEVNGLQITGTDLKNFLAENNARENQEDFMNTPDVLHITLSSFVDQMVWAEMARRDGIRLSHEDAMKVAAYEAKLFATRYVAEVLRGKAELPPEETKNYYREHQEDFLSPARVGLRHILVDSQAQAEQILAQARGGADFVQLVRKYSKDQASRDVGGSLGFVEAGKPTPGIGTDLNFERATLPLEVGQMAAVQSMVGWHVVLVEKREGGSLIPFEQVEETIKKGVTKKRWSRIYNEDLTAARNEIGARYITENFTRFSGMDMPGRFFQAASTSPQVMTRIELYRRVAFDFSDCPQAAEAQFMLGYIKLTELHEKAEAESAFKRLHAKFPKSPWRKAGDWLLQHLDEEDPKALGSPEEILGKTSGKP
jgi:hypothetical protein